MSLTRLPASCCPLTTVAGFLCPKSLLSIRSRLRGALARQHDTTGGRLFTRECERREEGGDCGVARGASPSVQSSDPLVHSLTHSLTHPPDSRPGNPDRRCETEDLLLETGNNQGDRMIGGERERERGSIMQKARSPERELEPLFDFGKLDPLGGRASDPLERIM